MPRAGNGCPQMHTRHVCDIHVCNVCVCCSYIHICVCTMMAYIYYYINYIYILIVIISLHTHTHTHTHTCATVSPPSWIQRTAAMESSSPTRPACTEHEEISPNATTKEAPSRHARPRTWESISSSPSRPTLILATCEHVSSRHPLNELMVMMMMMEAGE